MKRPVRLVRPAQLAEYLPYKRTALKELAADLLAKGLLEKVQLKPNGRAVAFTEDSVLRAQKYLMPKLGRKGGAK